jgi:peptidoglycan/xylan/chitin deacetylase (PgdA/CDA1 family)
MRSGVNPGLRNCARLLTVALRVIRKEALSIRWAYGYVVLGAALIVSTALATTLAVSADKPLSFDHAVTDKNIVALTFDADMTPGMLNELRSKKVASWYNEKVIAALRQEQVPATLFMTGLWIEAYGDATKDLSADPLFELGSHSYSHGAFHSPCYRLSPIPEAKQTDEIQKTDALLKKYTVSYKKYFRFPGLCYDALSAKKVTDQGYTVVGGDVDGADAFVNSPKWTASDIVAHVRPGSIVVLHMHGGRNAPDTAAALPDTIKRLRAEGYTFVKVSDLLELPPGEPVKQPVMARQTASAPKSNADTEDHGLFQHWFRR